jgi:hypothetical protein
MMNGRCLQAQVRRDADATTDSLLLLALNKRISRLEETVSDAVRSRSPQVRDWTAGGASAMVPATHRSLGRNDLTGLGPHSSWQHCHPPLRRTTQYARPEQSERAFVLSRCYRHLQTTGDPRPHASGHGEPATDRDSGWALGAFRPDRCEPLYATYDVEALNVIPVRGRGQVASS